MTHVVIVAMMGVGKSTTGRALALELGCSHVDSDDDIERLVGQSGRTFAEEHGVPALHHLEAAVLLGALAQEARSVITAAASTVEDATVRLVAPHRSFVVRLVAPFDETIKRQAAGGHRRPMSYEELAALAERREPFFTAVEDLRLDARQETSELVAEIVRHLPTS